MASHPQAQQPEQAHATSTASGIPTSTSSLIVQWAEQDKAQYERWFRSNKFAHFSIESLILLTLALTTVSAGLGLAAPLTASLSAATFVLTGARQLWRPQERWISYGLARDEVELALRRYKAAAEGDPAVQEGMLLRAVETAFEAERARWVVIRQRKPRDDDLAVPPTDGSAT